MKPIVVQDYVGGTGDGLSPQDQAKLVGVFKNLYWFQANVRQGTPDASEPAIADWDI